MHAQTQTPTWIQCALPKHAGRPGILAGSLLPVASLLAWLRQLLKVLATGIRQGIRAPGRKH